MKRNEFIRTSSAFVAGSVLLPSLACKGEGEKSAAIAETEPTRTNWAGNYTYKAQKLHKPATVEELQQLLRDMDTHKALGSRHCFNNIADSPLNQISTENLRRLVQVNKDQMQVTVESGMRYGDLAPMLEAEGLALHNLASLPHISIAGACATATHGSGVQNGNLASVVSGMELILSNGDSLSLKRQDPDFNAAVVHLGALGIVSRITLDVVPDYQVSQRVFLDLPFETAVNHFDEIMSGGYSVSLFTDWQDGKVSQVWVKRKADAMPETDETEYFGAFPADRDVHPIIRLSAENCTPQMGVPGPWYERLPHFKMGFTPSSGDELQSEFFIARDQAVEAFQALEAKKDLIGPQLQISEIRSVAADNLWLSPAYKRDVVAFHFTWKPNGPEVNELIKMIEKELSPFSVVPHWGKLFNLAPELLEERYEKIGDFRALAQRLDPEGKLRNAFLDRNLYREA